MGVKNLGHAGVLAVLLSAFSPFHAYAAKKAFVIGAHSDFQVEADRTVTSLQARGYSVADFFARDERSYTRAQVLQSLRAAANSATASDQFVISLQCHGWNNVDAVPVDHLFWDEHVCCFDDACSEYVSSRDMVEIASALRLRGARVAVMDNSCSGGATVLGLEAVPNVCAVATASASGPSLTGFPSFAAGMSNTASIRTMEDLAFWGDGELLREAADRVHQRAYMTGCARDSMRLRSAVSFSSVSVTDWALRPTRLWRFLYPDRTDADPVTATVPEILATSCRLRVGVDEAMDRFASYMSEWIETEAGSIGDLAAQIRGQVAALQRLRDRLEGKIRAYNIALDRVLGSNEENAPEADTTTVLSSFLSLKAKREELLALISSIREEDAKLNRLMTAFDQIDCRSRAPSPCRDFVI